MLQRDVAHEEGVSCPDLSTSCTRRKYLLRDTRQHMIRRANVSPRDRAPISRRRASVLTCARYKIDASRDCGSMKLLDPTGGGNYGERMEDENTAAESDTQ